MTQDTKKSVRRIGIANESGLDISQWTEIERLDAVILYRSSKSAEYQLPASIGIAAYSMPFQETLTVGWNLRLSDTLSLTNPEVIGWKSGRPIGMLGNVPSSNVLDFYQTITGIFGGSEEARTCERNEICRVASVGRMSEQLVREASERGADVYITNHMGQPGRVAMLETGIGVIAVGHKRAEQWGLRALRHVLRERYIDIEIIMPSTGKK